MSNVTIRKFPVTAPDGTEYRVKIEECVGLCDLYADVTLYIPRKRFGFKRVFSESYYHGSSKRVVYDAANPDFIAIATEAVRGYYANIEWSANYNRKRAESILRKQAALDRFAEWDGKITEVGE
ncbi:hypothetical protein J2T13_000218 [Paenibacillus sp. DS2015]|uniref:hypothetical protein n=1 Tax=Paenibacillus sp. DS2015 TaxID=3373917 RepID=UPI003D1CBF19